MNTIELIDGHKYHIVVPMTSRGPVEVIAICEIVNGSQWFSPVEWIRGGPAYGANPAMGFVLSPNMQHEITEVKR